MLNNLYIPVLHIGEIPSIVPFKENSILHKN